MELCCSVNGNRRCERCRRSFCDQHSYSLSASPSFFSPSFSVAMNYMCYPCYDTFVRKPHVETPRKGMSFSELYLAVRDVTPTGFISIEVKVQDHRPGVVLPDLQWSIYHEKLTHSTGKTPEEALSKYKTAWESWVDKSSPISNVNI